MADATICPACGNANRAAALFCDRCTYPLGVAGLNELSDADKRLCLSHLFEQLASASRNAEPGEPIDDDLWRAYLSAFWLRPETAIIEYREAIAIRHSTPTAMRSDRTSNDAHGLYLDLGCGDGIHTAISRGFRFDETFDAFQSIDLTKPDMYDAFDAESFHAEIVERGAPADVCFDIKPTAIARAAALNAIARAERADATRLPLAAASVGTIFSNMLRDLGEPLDAALAECARVLRDDGTLLLSTMTPAYAESLVFAPAARDADRGGDRAAAEQLLRLDRGRSVFCRRQLSAEQWNALLAKHHLRVTRTLPIINAEVTRLWDVGLRPFSADLMAWRQRAGRDELLAVKRVALAILDRILRPIVARAAIGEPCMQLLVVQKGRGEQLGARGERIEDTLARATTFSFLAPRPLPLSPTKPLVVMYHYVWPDAEPIPAGIRPMRASAFEAQLDWLSRRYDIVRPDAFLTRIDETSDRPPCLLTFDDGTRDHATTVAPILARRGIGGLFFIISDAARGKMMPTTHLAHWLLSRDDEAIWSALRRFAASPAELGDASEAARIYHYESTTRGRIKYALNMALPAPRARHFAINMLTAEGIGETTLARKWFASESDLRAMHDAGMTLALHGKTHASLQQLGAAIAEEIDDCSAFLRPITGEQPTWWACPFGGSGASNEAHDAMRRALRRAGVEAAVSTESGSVPASVNRLAIPRVDCVRVGN